MPGPEEDRLDVSIAQRFEEFGCSSGEVSGALNRAKSPEGYALPPQTSPNSDSDNPDSNKEGDQSEETALCPLEFDLADVVDDRLTFPVRFFR